MKRKQHLFLLALLGIGLSLSLTGCGGGGSHGPSYVFQDNFDSYNPPNPWTPTGGWTSSESDVWAIVAGFSGNGVQFNGSTYTRLTSSYTGTNYTVSVRVRLTSLTYDREYGIFARDDSSGHRYCARIINWDSTDNTEVRITKYWSGGDNSVAGNVLFTHDLDLTTYYTLTLRVSGNVITATLTDGTNTASCSFTDDGTTYGAVIPSGLAGIESTVINSMIFDDFRITTP